MFYAASEIVFWILLAAVIGGGVGYGLSQARTVRLDRRLSQSRADAPLERELAIAWDSIEDLNKRLQVAHETIRGGGEHVALVAEAPLKDDPADEPDDDADSVDNGTVGTRLSERVASASAAKKAGKSGS